MNIIYNDIDIANSVEPLKVQLIDNAGGIPDSIDTIFSDTNELWSKWKPQKNDTIEIKQNGYSTGVMYIDELIQGDSLFSIKALSIPQHSKTSRSQNWERVRFLEFVNEIAGRYGFDVKTYGIENYIYQRVDQIEQSDFSFLSYRSMLEGYTLKISNKAIVIYDENYIEQNDVNKKVPTIYRQDIIDGFEFKDKSTDIFSKCIVKSLGSSGYIQGKFEDKNVFGATLTKQINCSDIAEANRFAKGYLRINNKEVISGKFSITLNTNYAAGTNIKVLNIGMFDGKYFINKIIHDLIKNKSIIQVRKLLEGY